MEEAGLLRFSTILKGYGLVGERRQHFLDELVNSIRVRREGHNFRVPHDILTLVERARNAGDLDGATWLAFLAAHFGRASAGLDAMASATFFVFGFGPAPKWTWSNVSEDPERLRVWLVCNAGDLQKLAFGNHRKFESKKPDLLWRVIVSFLRVANQHGGAARLLEPTEQARTPEQRFEVLFRRFKMLDRFDRTGSYDFVELLEELGLVDAEPGSCYLEGSRGPLAGAKLLWCGRTVHELERLAIELARELGVPVGVLEDTLCNWQKHYATPK